MSIKKSRSAIDRAGNNKTGCEDFRLENGSMKGHNLAVTGLYVPCSLDRELITLSQGTNRFFDRMARPRKHQAFPTTYRGTSLIKHPPPLGLDGRLVPRALWWPWGVGAVSYERGTPVASTVLYPPPRISEVYLVTFGVFP